VGAKSRVVICGGYTDFAEFPVVHQKTTRFLGWSTKLRPKVEVEQHQASLTCWSDRWVPVWPVCDDAIRRLRSGGHALGLQGLRQGRASLRSLSIHLMVWRQRFPKFPSGTCILVLRFRGSVVFRLPLYNPSGERMSAISWNPSSFCFAIFLF
jgi:hypothetical protein